MLKISQLAKKSGLSTHTLRYYEKHGLISASVRNEAGYRLYSEADIRRVEFVKTARRVGFSLGDIASLLSIRLDKAGHSCEEVTKITESKLQDVEARIVELQSIQGTLQILLDSCCGGPEQAIHCSIMEALEDTDLAASRLSTNKLKAGDQLP